MYNNALHTLGAAESIPLRYRSIQILLTCNYRASLRNILVFLYAGEHANEAKLYIIHWLAKFSAPSPYLQMLMPSPAVQRRAPSLRASPSR